MVKADLVTGFLGSGKTTFIKQYAKYLKDTGEKVCVLENDFGAINVDMMLLSDLKEEGIDLEMVAGGCDLDCYIRRFKTKLITMALLGYTRVVIEPSGIFDVEEFFDIMSEDKIADMYDIASVFALADPNLIDSLSLQSKYLLASQMAYAGKIILTHVESRLDLKDAIRSYGECLNLISCKRILKENDFFTKGVLNLNNDDLKELSKTSYVNYSYVKHFFSEKNEYETLFFMNSVSDVEDSIKNILEDKTVGNIIRIKGFFEKDGNWYEINALKDSINIKSIKEGQKVIIVIGEKLNKKQIEKYLPSEYSTIRVYEDALKSKI